MIVKIRLPKFHTSSSNPLSSFQYMKIGLRNIFAQIFGGHNLYSWENILISRTTFSEYARDNHTCKLLIIITEPKCFSFILLVIALSLAKRLNAKLLSQFLPIRAIEQLKLPSACLRLYFYR